MASRRLIYHQAFISKPLPHLCGAVVQPLLTINNSGRIKGIVCLLFPLCGMKNPFAHLIRSPQAKYACRDKCLKVRQRERERESDLESWWVLLPSHLLSWKKSESRPRTQSSFMPCHKRPCSKLSRCLLASRFCTSIQPWIHVCTVAGRRLTVALACNMHILK